MSELSVDAIEQGTYVVTAVLTDENGDAVTPTALTWSLYNEKGVVVNGREDVAITPASTVNIVLSGDDLAISGNTDERRVFLLTGAYNSSLGSGLPLRDLVEFTVTHTP